MTSEPLSSNLNVSNLHLKRFDTLISQLKKLKCHSPPKLIIVSSTTDSNIIEPAHFLFQPSIDLESKGKISGMCYYGGAVVACSTDKSIKVVIKIFSTVFMGVCKQ